MTNTVIPMTPYFEREIIAKLFTKFSFRYGALWTTRLGANSDWKSCEDEWFADLKQFKLEHLRNATRKALSMYKDYPPTLGQIVELCLKESGVPDLSEVIRGMVAKNFSHPVTKMVYDKIGSWKHANGTEKEISQLTRQHYDTAVANFQSEPKQNWEKLTAFNSQAKELPAPDKLRTIDLRSYQAYAQSKLSNLENAKHPEFDETEIKKTHRNYKPDVFEEYKKFLLSLTEESALSLPIKWAHDRMRFISDKERPTLMKQEGYNPTTQGQICEAPRAFNGPTKLYKNWTTN